MGNISDVGELVRTKPWQLLKSSSSDKVTVGKLFVNFFHYYSHFPWEEKEVCVYRGNSGETPTSNMERKGKKNILDKPSDKTLMRVLDPFEFYNAARTVHSGASFDLVKYELKRAAELIRKNPCLDVFLGREGETQAERINEIELSKEERR